MTVLTLKNPFYTDLLFEYHARTGKVYYFPVPTPGQKSVVAEVLAEHCDTEARAFGFVQTFCRGIKLGERRATPTPTGEALRTRGISTETETR